MGEKRQHSVEDQARLLRDRSKIDGMYSTPLYYTSPDLSSQLGEPLTSQEQGKSSKLKDTLISFVAGLEQKTISHGQRTWLIGYEQPFLDELKMVHDFAKYIPQLPDQLVADLFSAELSNPLITDGVDVVFKLHAQIKQVKDRYSNLREQVNEGEISKFDERFVDATQALDNIAPLKAEYQQRYQLQKDFINRLQSLFGSPTAQHSFGVSARQTAWTFWSSQHELPSTEVQQLQANGWQITTSDSNSPRGLQTLLTKQK